MTNRLTLAVVLARLRAFILGEPTAILFTANALVSLGVAWGWHLSDAKAGAVVTIVSGLLTAATALLAKPPSVILLKGGLMTAGLAYGAFNRHWTADRVGQTAFVASLAVGLLLRLNVSPLFTSAEVIRRRMAKAAKVSAGGAAAVALLAALGASVLAPGGRAWNGAHRPAAGALAPSGRAWNSTGRITIMGD